MKHCVEEYRWYIDEWGLIDWFGFKAYQCFAGYLKVGNIFRLQECFGDIKDLLIQHMQINL